MCWTGWGNPNRMETRRVGDSWRLFDSTPLCGTTEGSFAAFEMPVLPKGLFWDTSAIFDQGTLAIAFVPESGRTAFIGLGLLFWLLRRKRRE